jgi:hypothetical protein
MADYWTDGHDPECLERRYCEQQDHEYWPAGFSSRDDLCTCNRNPRAEAKRPENADRRQDLEDWLDTIPLC